MGLCISLSLAQSQYMDTKAVDHELYHMKVLSVVNSLFHSPAVMSFIT